MFVELHYITLFPQKSLHLGVYTLFTLFPQKSLHLGVYTLFPQKSLHLGVYPQKSLHLGVYNIDESTHFIQMVITHKRGSSTCIVLNSTNSNELNKINSELSSTSNNHY